MKKISFTCFLVLTFFSAQSATFTANSPGGNWNTTSTWIQSGTDADGIPDIDDNIVINSGAMVVVSVNNQFVKFITINAGGILNFNNVDVFTCSAGNIINNGGISGSFSGALSTFTIQSTGGIAISGSGTINFSGNFFLNAPITINSPQTIISNKILIGDNGTTGYNIKNNSNVTTQILDGTKSTSTWLNMTNSFLTLFSSPFPTAGSWVLNAGYCANNTVTFDGPSSYTLNISTPIFENLIINGAGTKTLSAASTTTIAKNLTINSGATVQQSPSTGFTVNGFFLNNGTLLGSPQITILRGDLRNNGVISCPMNHTLKCMGTTIQIIDGSGNATLGFMQISNSAGVLKNSSNIDILQAINFTTGNINNSGGNFTLMADATKYARVGAFPTSCPGCSYSGSFTIQRYIPSRTAINWSDLSSPVSNSSMADWDNELFFSYPHTPPSVKSNVLAYDETIGDFVGVNAATALTAGKGFEITLTDDGTLTTFSNTTLTTVGTPNYGTQTFPLSYTNNTGGYYTQCPTCFDGENLVGNPFASAINVGSIVKTNTLAFIDVYNNATDNYLSLSSGLIGPHQGFWAYAKSAGASVSIPESAKSANTITNLRSFEQEQTEPFLQLTLSSADGSNMMAHTFKVACAIDAKDGWDEKDHKFRPSLNKLAPNLTADGEMFPLSVSTFNSNDDEYTMPLSVNVGIAGKFQINSKGIEFVNKDYSCVSLEDKVLHQLVDLNATTNYVFFASPNDNKDRFALHFSKNGNCKTMTSASLADLLENQVQILPTISGNSINFNFDQTVSTNVSVTNVLGQTIVETVSLQANTQTLNIELPDGFFGMYIVKVENENGVISKKFVKK